MDAVLNIEHIKSSVAQVAKLYNLKKVDLFGSYATGKKTKKSDVDLLVEFGDPSMTLFKLFRIQRELEELLGKKVDLIEMPISEESFLTVDKVVSIYG